MDQVRKFRMLLWCSLIFAGIVVNVVGKARVRWQKTKSSGNSTYTVTYKSEEIYFNKRISVYGSSKIVLQTNKRQFRAKW